MWMKIIDTAAEPVVSLVLDEQYLLECSYRKTGNGKTVVSCSKPIDTGGTSLEEKVEHFVELPQVQIELYSGEFLVKTVVASFNALYILEGIHNNRTVERLEFIVGFKNVNGEFVAIE